MFLELVAANNYGVLVIGTLTNALNIWLVVGHTSREMKVYSRILLQTCIIDSLLLAMTALIQPVKEL